MSSRLARAIQQDLVSERNEGHELGNNKKRRNSRFECQLRPLCPAEGSCRAGGYEHPVCPVPLYKGQEEGDLVSSPTREWPLRQIPGPSVALLLPAVSILVLPGLKAAFITFLVQGYLVHIQCILYLLIRYLFKCMYLRIMHLYVRSKLGVC